MYFYGHVGAIDGQPDMQRAFDSYRIYPTDAESLHSLAHMYEHGYGCARNTSKALELYAKVILRLVQSTQL